MRIAYRFEWVSGVSVNLLLLVMGLVADNLEVLIGGA